MSERIIPVNPTRYELFQSDNWKYATCSRFRRTLLFKVRKLGNNKIHVYMYVSQYVKINTYNYLSSTRDTFV